MTPTEAVLTLIGELRMTVASKEDIIQKLSSELEAAKREIHILLSRMELNQSSPVDKDSDLPFDLRN